jgi:hypothetical protein
LPDTVNTSITNPADAISMNGSEVQSPETYFGAARNQYLANGTQGQGGTQMLSFPASSSLQSNMLYLDGSWNFQPEYAETTSSSAKIKYTYTAKNVYMVASAKNPVTLKIYQDGTLVNTITVQGNTLYPLIQGSNYGEHSMEIDVGGAGLDAYTFTFG